MAISFNKIAKSFTGFSTPIFGVSWSPPETEREVVRKLFIYLEDKRVLYYPFDMESPHHVVDSILEIRKHLTEILMKLDESSELILHFRMMRASCRKFLDYFSKEKLGKRFFYPESLTKLGELRGVFGLQIAQLSVKYGIDVDDELSIILPGEDEEIEKAPIKKEKVHKINK